MNKFDKQCYINIYKFILPHKSILYNKKTMNAFYFPCAL